MVSNEGDAVSYSSVHVYKTHGKNVDRQNAVGGRGVIVLTTQFQPHHSLF